MFSVRLEHGKSDQREKKDTERILLENKRKIDLFHLDQPDRVEYYRRATNLFDPFKTLLYQIRKQAVQPKTLTNAWLKCWEILHEFKLIPYHHAHFRIFCNAELPGAFLFAIHHYITSKTAHSEYEWFANSLFPSHESILGDEFGLYRRHNEKWLMNAENGGSVTDPTMIQIISDRLQGSVDLYTSDIGIGLDQDSFHLQEERQAPLHLGQVICALKTLKKGGHMVCKMFMFFKPFSKWFLGKLMEVFEHLYICKPMSSRPGNSEVYLIGKGYKSQPEITSQLLEVLVNWNEASIENGDVIESFDAFLDELSFTIYERQIQTIQQNLIDVHLLYTEQIPALAVPVRKRIPRIVHSERNILTEWKKRYSIPPVVHSL